MKFYIKNKKIANVFIVVLVVAMSFLLTPTCFAMDVDEAAITVIGILAQLIVKVCGWFIGITIKAIVLLGSYNKFIDEYAIIAAWKIIRDFCNMFFILILLIISFATILRVESYNMKKWLPKLIIMAVLINFSRMICGLLIDISQVVFLTFISTLSENGSDFITLAKVDDTLNAVKDVAKDPKVDSAFFRSAASIIAAVVFLVIAMIVLLAILIVIVMRVVMFWIYVVLSPLAFLLASFPGGQKYASQYWGEFTKYLVNGPVLAFFIWLSLVATNGTSGEGGIAKMQFIDKSKKIMDLEEATQIFTTSSFMSYVMGIGMLVGGLIVSAQVGGIGGSFGKNMLNKAQSKTTGLLKSGAAGIAKFGGRRVATGSLGLVSKSPVVGKTSLGKMAGSWRGDLIKSRADGRKKKMKALGEKLGMKEDTFKNVEDVANSKTGKFISTAGKAAVRGTVTAGLLASGGGIPAAIAGIVAGAGYAVAKTNIGSKKEKKKREKKDIEETANILRGEEIDKAKTERDEKIKNSEDERKDKIKDVSSPLLAGTYIADETIRNANIKNINDSANKDIETTNADYEDEKKDIDKMYQNRVERGVLGIDNVVIKANLEFDKKKELDKLQANFDTEIQTINDEGLSPMNRAQKIKEARQNYDTNRSRTEKEHNEEINNVGTSSTGRFLDKHWGDYHPNKTIIAAAKEGAKDSETARKRVGVLAEGESIAGFPGSSTYSASGQNAAQKKFFDQLTAGSDKSNKAISKMVDDLTRLSKSGNLEDFEKSNIESFKKGIAAYDKGGKDVSSLSAVIEVVNKIDTGHKDGAMTVDDFKPKVIG
jgi:hypothetical protein